MKTDYNPVIVECLRILARRGRALRLAAEQERLAAANLVLCGECGEAPAVVKDGWVVCGKCGKRIRPQEDEAKDL